MAGRRKAGFGASLPCPAHPWTFFFSFFSTFSSSFFPCLLFESLFFHYLKFSWLPYCLFLSLYFSIIFLFVNFSFSLIFTCFSFFCFSLVCFHVFHLFFIFPSLFHSGGEANPNPCFQLGEGRVEGAGARSRDSGRHGRRRRLWRFRARRCVTRSSEDT